MAKEEVGVGYVRGLETASCAPVEFALLIDSCTLLHTMH